MHACTASDDGGETRRHQPPFEHRDRFTGFQA